MMNDLTIELLKNALFNLDSLHAVASFFSEEIDKKVLEDMNYKLTRLLAQAEKEKEGV